MARRITFEIVTRAQTRGLNNLAKALANITKNAKNLNKDLKLDKLSQELNSVNASARQTSQVLSRAGRTIQRDLGTQTERAAKNVETLQTRFRGLNNDISRLDRSRNRLKSLSDDIANSEERLAVARREVADATSRLRRVERDPQRTADQIDEATRAYNSSTKAVQRAETAHRKLRDSFRSTMQEAVDSERRINDLEDSIEKLRRTAGGEDIIKKLLPPSSAQQLRVARDSLNSFQNVMDKTLNVDRRRIGAISSGFGALRGQLTQLAPSIPILRNLRQEVQAMARLDTQDIMRGIGNTDAAIRQTTRAMQQQSEAATKIQGETQRLTQSMNRWVSAESRASSALSSGNTAMLERRRIQQMLTRATSQASSVETTAAKQQEALLSRRRQLMQEQLDLTHRINRAQSQLVQRQVGTSAYRQMEGDLNRLRTAYTAISGAIRENDGNIRKNQSLMNQAGSAVEQMTRSTNQWQDAMQSLIAQSRQNPFQNMIRSIQQLNQFAMRLAATFTSRVRGAITSVANAARSFVNSSANMFAGLQRALQSTGNYFQRFADRVTRSMDRSQAAMMQMYAAGFGLMQVGREINQFGVQGFRMMGRSLEGFMEYEDWRNRAAIAGAQSLGPSGQPLAEGQTQASSYSINSEIVDRMIFELQRGTMTPDWLGGSGRRIPVTFDATELAEGMYYFSSAIGLPITEQNMTDVGGVVSTMMQMANVTGTGVEEATKGVLNIAMEFGFDPRKLASENAQVRAEASEEIAKITAQVGYLSNISTMEVSDVIETFKMVGPMANILSGGEQGAGLNETFLMAFLASEVGLRGGNVGRGISRAFTSLLDPTPKMVEVMGQYFDDVVDEDTFKARFFEPGSSTLKGGILGFMETLASVDPNVQAQMLAELFTENATRSLVGTIGEFAEGGGIQGILDQLEGENPLLWLEAAVAQSVNSITGWFDFMANGWFQLQAAMVGSIEGPLMAGFQLLGEFFFTLAKSIHDFPIIGQVLSGIVTGVLSLAAVGGTILMIAGGILLLGRAFSMFGGFVLPFIRLIAMAAATLGVLAPIILLVGAAVGLAVMAFQNNVFGIQDALGDVVGFFSDFEGNIVPLVERIFETFARIGDAIRIFFESILLGGALPSGDANSLFAGIQSIFGDLLGGEIINALMRFRAELEPTREAIRNFLDESTFDVAQLDNLGLAIQGFFEQVFLGQQRLETAAAQNALGEAFGIENLSVTLNQAATDFRGFIEQVIGFAAQVVNVWTTMGTQIYSNIARIFAGGGGLSAVFQSIGIIIQGIAQGIILAFTGVLASVAFVTDKIADFADGVRAAETQGRSFMGMAVSFEGILRAIGITIGTMFGVRLALMFSPLATMLVRIVPLVAGLGSALVGLGAQFLVVAGNIAISVAAFAGHLAAMAAYYAMAALGSAVNAAFSVSSLSASTNTGILAGAVSVAAGAMTLLATTAFTAATATSMLGASMALVASVGFLAVAALAGIAAIVTGVAAAMIVWVGATQGLSAAMSALMSFLSGVWSGLQMGITLIQVFVSVSMMIATVISNVLGVGDAFAVMGFIVGAAISGIIILIAALIGALAALAIAWATAWVAANIGPVLVVLAIAAIAAAIYGLVQLIQSVDWGGMWDGLTDAARTAWDSVVLFAASSIDLITAQFAEGINAILNTALEAGRGAGVQGPLISRLTEGVEFDLTPTNLAESVVKTQEAERAARDTASAFDDLSSGYSDVRIGVSVDGEEEVQGFMGFLDDIGAGGHVREVMLSIGLDPNNLSLDDLSVENLTEIFSGGGVDGFDASGVDFGFDSIMTKYQEDLAEWQQFQAVVERSNYQIASDFYESMGWEIPPMERPDFMGEDYFGSVADEIDADAEAAAATLEETKQKWTAAVEGLSDMALPDIFSALYDPLAGEGGTSAIGFLSSIGDDIISKAQADGGAEWLNMNEFLADVAGTGIALDENLVGRNMRTALRPAFEILSRQTGVSIEELMADIPIFSAPEQFQNIATADMTKGISEFVDKFGVDMYETVDTSLQGLINQDTGESFFQYGLDWSELNNFAIGQAILGHDWNLADFVSEVMGISVADAEQVLLDAGISPEVADQFGSNMFQGVEDAVLSNAGEFNALTTEQYEWLHEATQGFTSDIIHMTESEFGAMSDTMKLILSNMGYTFVITDLVPHEAYAAAEAAITDFTDYIGTLGEESFGRISENANWEMEGDPREWLKVAEFENAAGELMVVLQDVDGTQVTIPAAKYDEFQSSLEEAERIASEWSKRIKAAFDEGFRNATAGGGDGTGGGGGLISGFAGGQGGVTSVYGDLLKGQNAQGAKALGLPESVKIKVEADLGDIESDLEAIRTMVKDIGGDGTSTFTIRADTTNLSETADALETMSEAIKGIPKDQNLIINADTSNLSEAAEALKEMSDALQDIPKDLSLDIVANTSNLSESAEALKTMSEAIKAVPREGLTLDITASTSNLSETADALETIKTALQGMPTDQVFTFAAETGNLTETADALAGIAEGMERIQNAGITTISIAAETSNLTETQAALEGILAAFADLVANHAGQMNIVVNADTSNLTETQSALEGISDAMMRITNSGMTTITVNAVTTNLTETQAALEGILGAITNLVQQHAGQFNLVVNADTSNLTETQSALDGIATALERVGNSGFTNLVITATTVNLSETNEALSGILSTLTGLVSEHAGQFNLVINASTEGLSEARDALQEVQTLMTGEGSITSTTITITSTGGDVVLQLFTDIGVKAAEMAVTWTATIAETGGSGVISSITNAITTAQTYAVTWTGVIVLNGEATVVGAIGRAINTARAFAVTWTATINVNDNASSSIRTAISLLDSFNNRSATATMTTRNVTENITIGGNMLTAATGGWRSGGQAVLVGEEGPEVVYFPTNGYVFTAPETESMLSESLSASTNPFASRSSQGGGGQDVHVAQTHSGDTFNFYGDIKIESPQAAEAWFDEMDRRSGKRVEMARRGMRAVEDTTSW